MLATPTARLIPPQAAGSVRVLDGHALLVFEVESAPLAVRVDGDGFPYRIGDTTRPWSAQAINAVKDLGIIESAEARRSRVPLAALDQALIARARDAAGLNADESRCSAHQRKAASSCTTTPGAYTTS